MLKFNTIRWKNLLSTGNYFTELRLDRSPNTLIVGSNGSGKCLRGNTQIDIEFANESIKELFVAFVGKSRTIKSVVDFYNQYPELCGQLLVNTRNGNKVIEFAGITAYDSEVIRVETQSGNVIEASPEHLLWSGDDWVKVKDLSLADSLLVLDNQTQHLKPSLIVSKNINPGREDLYDLQVSGKEFIANGIVSHNSTLLDALCFVLFGKGFRNINKPTLINSINAKDCVVEIEFEVGNRKYKIIRGIKPTVFEIYCDGILTNQDASTKDYQDHLEKNILKLNYKSFTQIVILGSASFTPFMQLSSADRRDIIEDLLDIKVFSLMNSGLKSQATSNKQSIDDNKHQTDLCNTTLTMLKTNAQTIKENNDEIIKSKELDIIDTESSISNTTNSILSETKEVSTLQGLVVGKSDVDSSIQKLSQLEFHIESNQKNNKKTIDFFHNNDDCPTCRQTISLDFKNDQLNSLDSKSIEYKDALEKIAAKLRKQQNNLHDIQNILKEIQNKQLSITSHNTTIASYNRYITTLRKEIAQLVQKNVDVTDNRTELLDAKQKLQSLIDSRKELLDEKSLLESAGILLKDTGIKTKIIKRYLPVINKQVNKYLSAMDFFVNFNLDESFKEVIRSRHRDEFSYASFSEGEKQKIDISLLLTWRHIAKLKNSVNTNLLIMDEVFDSSLDANGTEYLMSLLHILEGTNLFVISHKGDILQDKFRSLIKFEKINNFSRISK